MHDELHPLRGGHPIRVVRESLPCRFRDEDHFHHVHLYPETWSYQVKWQHRIPDRGGLAALDLNAPTLVFEAEEAWYSLHAIAGPRFHPAWERFVEGGWVPFAGLDRTQGMHGAPATA